MCEMDMVVDGDKNTVSEIDIVPQPLGEKNPYGNTFVPKQTVLTNEKEAVRTADPSNRAWKISNADGKLNPISIKSVADKFIPCTRGPAMPTLMTPIQKPPLSPPARANLPKPTFG